MLLDHSMDVLMKIAQGADLSSLPLHADDSTEKGTSQQRAVSGPASEVAIVHALNVLRMLFRDSALRFSVIPYLPDALILCIEGYTSERYHLPSFLPTSPL